MPLAKCVRCKKMFNKVDVPVCGDCRADEEEDYGKIRDLLDKRPDLNAEQVSEETGVDLECVFRMMDAGLITTAAAVGEITCGMCGAPAISASKRLCQACLDKLNYQVAHAQSQVKMAERKAAQIGLASTHATFDSKRKK